MFSLVDIVDNIPFLLNCVQHLFWDQLIFLQIPFPAKRFQLLPMFLCHGPCLRSIQCDAPRSGVHNYLSEFKVQFVSRFFFAMKVIFPIAVLPLVYWSQYPAALSICIYQTFKVYLNCLPVQIPVHRCIPSTCSLLCEIRTLLWSFPCLFSFRNLLSPSLYCPV